MSKRGPIDYLRPQRRGFATPQEWTGEQLKSLIGLNVRELRLGGTGGYARPEELWRLGYAMGYPSGSAKQAAWRWEQGESLSFNTFAQLAIVLGVDPVYLLTPKRTKSWTDD